MKLVNIILLSAFFIALFFNSVAGHCKTVTKTVTKTTAVGATTATCPGKSVTVSFTVSQFTVTGKCVKCPPPPCPPPSSSCVIKSTATKVICTTVRSVVSESSCCPPTTTKSATVKSASPKATAKTVSPKAKAKGKRR